MGGTGRCSPKETPQARGCRLPGGCGAVLLPSLLGVRVGVGGQCGLPQHPTSLHTDSQHPPRRSPGRALSLSSQLSCWPSPEPGCQLPDPGSPWVTGAREPGCPRWRHSPMDPALSRPPRGQPPQPRSTSAQPGFESVSKKTTQTETIPGPFGLCPQGIGQKRPYSWRCTLVPTHPTTPQLNHGPALPLAYPL